MKREYILRVNLISLLFILMAIAIVFQLVRIQTSQQAQVFLKQGDLYSGYLRTVYPSRGEIYDRNGYLLAGNETVYEVGVDLNLLKNAHTVALTLSVTLGIDFNQLHNQLLNPKPGQIYVLVKNHVDPAIIAELKVLQEQVRTQTETAPGTEPASLAGLIFRPHFERNYPEKTLAANVLGFVNREGRGYFGIEEKYDNLLAGVPQTVWIPADPNRTAEIPDIPNGTTLILTLDREIQASVEEILDRAIYQHGAKTGSIVVMDPKNGEILAMASYPRMDLNQFWRYGEIFNKASEFNRAISMPYEPGSVFKIITMAAALDTDIVEPTSSYLDTGVFYIRGNPITNWDNNAWGWQDMHACMKYSLNICIAWLATELQPQTFYRYAQDFGIGKISGIDLANEAEARLKVPGDQDWHAIDLGTNSFGQGVTVTPIQMVTAASAIANQGRMVSPHILYGMVSNDRQYLTTTQYLGSPISAETARQLTEMLAKSLDDETSLAHLPGYRLAGKTGTAQIPGPNGRYLDGVTNTSFIGWGPVDDPRFIIYVWLEKPSSSIWGSQVAAPVFRDVAKKMVVLLDIPPDITRRQFTGP